METDSPVVYHGTSESRFPPEKINKTQLQLSPEEIRTLRECNRESFYYRCLPLSVAGVTATYLAFKQGYLKGHARWGPAGKMTGAVFLGWLIGKFSYRTQCEDKFLRLENSVVGNAIRKRRGYVSETFESEGRLNEDLSVNPGNYKSFDNDDYHSSTGSLNLDVDKNVQYSGLDDRERPTTDNETTVFRDDGEPVKKVTSYDELRRKNREDYERLQNRQQSKTDPSQTGGTRQWRRSSNEQPRQFNEGPLEGGSRNAYGDNWDNPKFT